MNLQNITLFSFGYFDNTSLKMIAEIVQHELSLPVQIKEGLLDLSDFYEPKRNQYNANNLLEYIDHHYSSDTEKIIGLFNVDFFIPIFTYIFGQAYLGGRVGIASVFRLHNERYGMKADETLLMDRYSKEVIHELGHTFGLIHCHVPDCIMRSGSYVEDIDQKSSSLCPKCRQKLFM